MSFFRDLSFGRLRVAGLFPFENPTQVKPRHHKTALQTAFKLKIDPSLARRPGPSRTKRGTDKILFVDPPLHRPRMATIEDGSNGFMVAAAGAIGVAVDQDILVVNGQAHQSAHAAITGVLGPVRKHFTNRHLLPGRATVLAASNANTGTAPGRPCLRGQADAFEDVALRVSA